MIQFAGGDVIANLDASCVGLCDRHARGHSDSRPNARSEDARGLRHQRGSGNATLFVSPSGESMLMDTGKAGAAAPRDAGRIVAAIKDAGLRQIDLRNDRR
jgi:hypothetical protein